MGSEGKDVVDEEEEMKYAIGVVIDRDLFPDKLFAPAKRGDLMPDGTNPVLDKELRSEIFSQGTLMLRVVIQVSMLLSIPLMAGLLFLRSDKAPYYVAYVLTFNLLVGPVFSSGSITQERERQTLALLLTTLLTPGRIVLAKLIAALRVSTVLTFLLTEQLLLAYVLLPGAAVPVLDAPGLPADHRDDLPGDLVGGAHVLGARPADLDGDGPDLSVAAGPVRAADGPELVPPGNEPGAVASAPSGWPRSRSPARTRPPSACRCTPVASRTGPGVPMHVEPAVLVHLWRGVDLPVWTIFLALYPPLSFLFLGITYLAFRWRWWKAGDSG